MTSYYESIYFVGYLELSYAGIPGHVRIQCMENKLYLGMNKNGRLYGEVIL